MPFWFLFRTKKIIFLKYALCVDYFRFFFLIIFLCLDFKIFGSVLDPLLTTLVLTSTHLNPIDLAVYMLNCLHNIISMLSLYEYTDERLEMLQAQVT